MKSLKPLILILAFILLSPTLAFAYLDPGSGSLLLSSIIALFASFIFFIKSLFYKTLSFFKNGLSFQHSSNIQPLIGGGGVIPSSVNNPLYSSSQTLTSHSIVFYSEGAQYYNTFKPILDALDTLHHPYTYYSSDENDPGLKRIKSHRDSLDSQKLESQSSCMDSGLDSKCLESLNSLQHLDGLDAQSRDSLSTPHLLDSKYRESQTRGSLDSKPSESQHNFHTLSHCAYIGKGNKAYSFLNTLQADILVLTTPGLDVLHIKRQAGVKHYCHIVHSLSPMTYRVFGVDYFHSVLVANAVQRDFVRQIESAHNLKPKHIAITGSTYLDELYKIYSQMLNTQAEHNQSSQDLEHSNTAQQTQALKHSKLTQDSHLSQNPNLDSQHSHNPCNLVLDSECSEQTQYLESSQDLASHPSPRILVSPSWGKESLLSKYALKLLLPLAQSGFSLLIRPHPQSSISPSEASNLAYLKDALKEYKNVSWDSNVSNVPAFMYSDLMISDFSSVIFDYVCLQGKPVITIEDEMDLSGYDMADIPRDQIWTFKALKSIGKRIHPSEFHNLKEIILQICKEYRGSQAKSKEKLDSGLDTEGDSTLESQNLDSKSSCVDSTSESKFKSETGLDSQAQTSHKQNLVSLVADSQNLDSRSQSVSESYVTLDAHSSHNTLDSLAHNLSSIQKLLWQYPHNAGLQSALELLKIERELLQNALKPQARLVARYTELEGMIQSAQAKRSGLDAQPISESESPPEHQTPGTHSSIDQSTHCISNH